MADKSDKNNGAKVPAEEKTDKKATATKNSDFKRNSRRALAFTGYMFGNFISVETLRRNIGFILLVVVCMLLYIGNGYSSQQELIEINKLKGDVEDAKYNALVRSSELLEKSRQSHIEEILKSRGDTTLQTATTSPYILKIDTAE